MSEQTNARISRMLNLQIKGQINVSFELRSNKNVDWPEWIEKYIIGVTEESDRVNNDLRKYYSDVSQKIRIADKRIESHLKIQCQAADELEFCAKRMKDETFNDLIPTGGFGTRSCYTNDQLMIKQKVQLIRFDRVLNVYSFEVFDDHGEVTETISVLGNSYPDYKWDLSEHMSKRTLFEKP